MIVDIFYYGSIFSMGILFVHGTLVMLVDALAKFWPNVDAEILAVSATSLQSGTKGSETFYKLIATYVYTYKGIRHESSRLNSFNSVIHTNKEKIEGYLASINSGNVKVRVLPFYPGFSLLLPGSYNKVLVVSIVAISFLFLLAIWWQKMCLYA